MVFAELRRRYSAIFYYNENRKECDFIVVRNYVPQLDIQVCYALTAENRKREVDGLLDACSFFKMGHGLILTYNPVSYTHLDVYKRQAFMHRQCWMLLREK